MGSKLAEQLEQEWHGINQGSFYTCVDQRIECSVNVWNSLPADPLIVFTFLLLLPSNRQLNKLILVSFYSAMTIKLVLAELLCCGCERVFCNSLYFMFLHFILYCGQL